MKTKAEIVQRLLGEGKIDAEEAVVLLMRDDAQPVIYYPALPLNPYPDPFPYPQPVPWWPYGPFITYSIGQG